MQTDKNPRAFGRERKGDYAPHAVLLHEQPFFFFLDVVHVLDLLHARTFLLLPETRMPRRLIACHDSLFSVTRLTTRSSLLLLFSRSRYFPDRPIEYSLQTLRGSTKQPEVSSSSDQSTNYSSEKSRKWERERERETVLVYREESPCFRARFRNPL